MADSSCRLLTVCCMPVAFAYGFSPLTAGLQKASFHSVKGYLLKDERPCFAS